MQRYKELGMKLTPQRLAVLRHLEDNYDHPSADDIFRAVSRDFPIMSFATVYNTLEALRRRGEVAELSIDPARKRFDPDTAPHNHLMCTKCKKIVDIHQSYAVAVPTEIGHGFEITGSHVEFYGVCPACKKNGKPLASQGDYKEEHHE